MYFISVVTLKSHMNWECVWLNIVLADFVWVICANYKCGHIRAHYKNLPGFERRWEKRWIFLPKVTLCFKLFAEEENLDSWNIFNANIHVYKVFSMILAIEKIITTFSQVHSRMNSCKVMNAVCQSFHGFRNWVLKHDCTEWA